jgi:predicted phosphodiesterase
MRILLAGDSHGNFGYVHDLVTIARQRECDRVFILGDFGYWEHSRPMGPEYLDGVSHLATSQALTIHFLDGNHDNHPMLWSCYGDGRKRQEKVRPSLFYHGRGLRWEWNGVAFMSLGGGYSIDKEYRRPWASWWPTETLTDEDVVYSIRRGRVDVLLCHDAPADVNLTTHGGWGAYKQGIPESESNRERLQRVINVVEPQLVVHGHMHMNYVDTSRDGRTKVLGLAHDSAPLDEATRVLELNDGEWHI